MFSDMYFDMLIIIGMLNSKQHLDQSLDLLDAQ